MNLDGITADHSDVPTVLEGGALGRVLLLLTNGTLVIAKAFLVLAMLALCGLTLYIVFGRFVLHYAPPMLSEFSGFVFVWICFIGAAVVLWQNTHARIDTLLAYLPSRAARVLEILSHFAVLAFFLAMTWYGYQVVDSVYDTTAPTSGISMAFLYGALFVAGVLSSLYTVTALVTRYHLGITKLILGAVVLGVVFAALSGVVVLPTSFVFAVLGTAILSMIAIGAPIAVCLGFAAFMGIALTSYIPLLVVPQKMVDGLNTFVLAAVPFYLLVGGLMASGSTATRLLRLANAMVGWVRGGIGLADIVASAIFADISGSAVADTAAIGSVIGPELMRRGFRREYAAALQAAAGAQGILFPPSVTMIVYAWVANVSVGDLFLSLFIPGLLVMVSFMVVTYITARVENLPAVGRFSIREFGSSFRGGFMVLWTPIIILTGILTGVATPTEIGVIAVVYTFLLEVFIYKDLTLHHCGSVILQAALTTGRVGLLIASASALGWILVANEGPQMVINWLVPIAHSPIMLLILLNLFLVAIHTVLEAQTTTLVIVPLLLPVLARYDISLIHFGVILNLNSAIGLIMPPIGICLYMVSTLFDVPVGRVVKDALKFAAILAIDLAIVIAFPSFSTVFVHGN